LIEFIHFSIFISLFIICSIPSEIEFVLFQAFSRGRVYLFFRIRWLKPTAKDADLNQLFS